MNIKTTKILREVLLFLIMSAILKKQFFREIYY